MVTGVFPSSPPVLVHVFIIIAHTSGRVQHSSIPTLQLHARSSNAHSRAFCSSIFCSRKRPYIEHEYVHDVQVLIVPGTWFANETSGKHATGASGEAPTFRSYRCSMVHSTAVLCIRYIFTHFIKQFQLHDFSCSSTS